jgi:hypothetical protein
MQEEVVRARLTLPSSSRFGALLRLERVDPHLVADQLNRLFVPGHTLRGKTAPSAL